MKKMMRKTKYWFWGGVALVGSLCLTASSISDFSLGRNAQILFNMFRDVSLFYVDSVDTDTLLLDAAEGMVANLDPYTELLPEKEMDEFEIQTTGKYGGIGALIRQSGDYVIIAQPYKGFPADKAGLVIGDKLMAVDGQSIQGYDPTKVSGMLKGTPGTTMKLTVEKLLSGEQTQVSVKRERIYIPSIPYYGVLEGGVGYILHHDFSEECSNDMRIAFEKLKRQGITSLILDLRSNGGGVLQEAVKILSMFVPKGTEVVSMRGRMKESDAVFKTQLTPLDLQIPIVVLVNSTTASAAEIVSGALQDLDRAVLVGQRTFGKGLVQTTRPVGFNAY
ncbi:MAG: S41 family peptidase, partial [Alistipes sp.]|nr:S41 family peptidase [Alistipes sp.]